MVPMGFVGVNDCHAECGPYAKLQAKYGLDANAIAAKVKETIAKIVKPAEHQFCAEPLEDSNGSVRNYEFGKEGKYYAESKLVAPYTINLEEVEKPVINDDQVLLKVHAVGICASDMHDVPRPAQVYDLPCGLRPRGGRLCGRGGRQCQGLQGRRSGHRGAQVYCGECYPCQIGAASMSASILKVQGGVHKDGMACEYFAVEPKYLHHCPDGMKDERMAPGGAPGRGRGFCQARRRRHRQETWWLWARGTIGNLTAQAAKALGAANVMITDVFDPSWSWPARAAWTWR